MTTLSVLFGAIIGLSLGLTGGGGAVFAVPMLVYGLGLPTREAVTVSMFSVGITALIGFLQKWRQAEAELRTGFLFALAGMMGAPAGSWLAGQLPDTLLMLLFAGLMLTIAVTMWRKSQSTPTNSPVCVPMDPTRKLPQAYQQDGPRCQRDPQGNLVLTSRCARLLLLVGLGTGLLSGMFGVGGGFIIVPALIVFSGMSLSRAVGTSLMVIALISVSGIASQVAAGHEINLRVAPMFIIGGFIGLWLGQRMSHHCSPAMLQRFFAVAILLVAAFVIFKNLHFG